jgi:chromosome segregation ATPase
MKAPLLNDERQISDLLPAGFDPHQAMRILADYLRSLEASFEELKKTSAAEKRNLLSEQRTLLKTCEDQQQQIDRLTNDLMDLTNTMEEQESQLATANQKVANYEKQSKKLHRENSDLTNRLTQKENDANFFHQELERCRSESEHAFNSLNSANNKLEELERRLAAERETAAAHEKEARRLTLDLSESQGKNLIIERKLEDTVIKYGDEIKRLNERLNADAQHEAALLKKRVRSSLAPEIRDLEKMSADKLSIEAASNLKALLGRFIAKLEQAGIDLK